MGENVGVQTDVQLLRATWAALCEITGVARHELAFQLIASAYAESHRHYHNAHHVAECLRELAPMRGLCEQPLAASAAMLFHDYVYYPARHDNEQRSADEAMAALRAIGWGQPDSDAVRGIILATKHETAPSTTDAAIVCDIDLSILGKPAQEFDAYERAIRKEYVHVPEVAYRAGRAAVLRGLLSRASIYATDPFRVRYEMTARQNLGQSIAALEQ